VGLAGAVHPNLSGAQNTRFIARVYGVDTEELIDFVQDFAQLGPHFFMDVRTYSAGMRARLNFGLSMGIKFDTYLIDEVTGAGDAAFRSRSVALFQERMAGSDAIMVNHNLAELKEFCDAALVLEHGKLRFFEDLDEAIEAHKQNMI
jgi:capsular polysaccharide transport system ATP-binding protein